MSRNILAAAVYAAAAMSLFVSSSRADEMLPVPNPDFEFPSEQSPTLPNSWQIGRWNLPADFKPEIGLTPDFPAAGKSAAFTQAAPAGASGFITHPMAFPASARTLKFTVKVKPSSDYKNNRPWIFVQWYKDRTWLKLKEETPSQPLTEGKWNTFTLEIPRSQIPAEANGLTIALASIISDKNAPVSGRLYFDDLQAQVIDSPANFPMQADQSLAWYTLGHTVKFTTARTIDVPDAVQEIVGTIYDMHGVQVDRVSLSREVFVRDGWTWKPPATGYYEIEFSCRESGREKSFPLTYQWRARNPKGELRYFTDTRYSLSVAPGEPRPVSQRPSQIGANAMNGDDAEKTASAIHNLGLSFAGIKDFGWSDIEQQRGVYDWSHVDPRVLALKKARLPMVGQIYGTPQWASPHPEKTELDICVKGYTAFAPKNMEDFRAFTRAVVTRYKNEIHDWEIWNEPHLPYGSVFWRDTPERYVDLLRAGQDAVKSVQPDAIVWIGGMGGKRYLPFYREILRLGVGGSFDRLALHGTWAEPSGYRMLEKRFNAPQRPWVNSEWHAILYNTSDPVLPTDVELSRRMMLDLSNQFKHGVENIQVFTMFEYMERQAIEWAKQEGWWMNCGGFFRKVPYFQPRPATIVLRTFTDQFSGKIHYVGEYQLSDGQKAIALESDSGPVLLVWSDTKKAQNPDNQLLACARSGRRLIDWEGRTVEISNWKIQPDTMYLISGSAQTAQLLKGHVLPQTFAEQTMGNVDSSIARAPYSPSLENPRWITSGWQYTPLNKKPKPGEFAARMAVVPSSSGMDIIVEVTDSQFHQPAQDRNFYQGDSIQLALATDETLMPGSYAEFQVALTESGPVVFKDFAPYVGGDLPPAWTGSNQVARFAHAQITRTAQGLRYQIHMDASELYPFAFAPGEPIRFSLLVNNNNGQGRAGYLSWGNGIGEAKNPVAYGMLEAK